MRKIPQRDRPGRTCPSGLTGDVGDRSRSVVDDGTHHHGNVVESIEAATDLHAAGPGDAVDHVAIRGEVGGVDRDHATIGT